MFAAVLSAPRRCRIALVLISPISIRSNIISVVVTIFPFGFDHNHNSFLLHPQISVQTAILNCLSDVC